MSNNQNMFEDNFPNYTSAHSTSDSKRLSKAYPNSPIHSGKSITIVEFTRAGVKKWYEDNVLSGEFENTDFTESNYDYKEAPRIPHKTVEGEGKPGAKGSTIVKTGLGPNVATIDRANIANTPMVDASPTGNTPFEGAGTKDNPHTTSPRIAGQKLTVALSQGEGSSAGTPS